MSERKCRTCEHWQTVREQPGVCVRLVVGDAGERFLHLRTLNEVGYLSTAEHVTTGPEFGCVRWMPRD